MTNQRICICKEGFAELGRQGLVYEGRDIIEIKEGRQTVRMTDISEIYGGQGF